MEKSNTKNEKYEAVIGLEIHAELKTKSKMFCSCANSTSQTNPEQLLSVQGSTSSTNRNVVYGAGAKLDNIADQRGKAWRPKEPNTDICPVCLGMPGTLPVMNKKAIEWTILTGLALNCKVNKFTKWDRKNYFYPDLPKGYQISQFDLPLVYDGYLEINSKSETLNSKQIQNSNDQNPKRRIGITRIHLEEDTGTSKHPEGRAEVDYSLLDYNRAGVPLMELVTEPDIRSAQEAKEFCMNYQLILQTLKIADADMEKGQMRCEANISIRKKDDKKFGTKVEIKNLNSFKSVEKSIEYEIERQIDVLESGEKIVQQTRGWDEKNGKTYVMRTKETSADYRYFPEPDLPPVTISDKKIREIDKQLPELPKEKAERYQREYILSTPTSYQLSATPARSDYFESVVEKDNAKLVANWMINEDPEQSIPPKTFKEMINLIQKKIISERIAKDILPEIKAGRSPSQIIKEKGLEQISDTSELEKIVDQIIKDSSQVVESIRNGKMEAIGFLVGQVMKKTRGQANPEMVNEILRKKLGQS